MMGQPAAQERYALKSTIGDATTHVRECPCVACQLAVSGDEVRRVVRLWPNPKTPPCDVWAKTR
jgi:hypothetical protein